MNNSVDSNTIIRKGINFDLFTNREDIKKGEVTDALQYSGIKFKKSGKDIKAALEKVKADESTIEDTVLDQLNTLKPKMPVSPFQPVSEYYYRGFKQTIGEQLGYPYSMCYFNENSTGNTMEVMDVKKEEGTLSAKDVTPKSKEEAALYSLYNQTLHKYIEKCADVQITNMYIDNLKDNQSYELDTRQMTILYNYMPKKD